HFAPMSHTRVDTAPVRIKPADDHVVEADQRRKHAHRRDQPERCVAGDRERETDHIGFAGTPVAVKNRRRALPIDIARTLNVRWYQFPRLKRDGLARRGASLRSRLYDIPCTLMMLTRLAVGLEPLNAPDAAHRSPRSIRIRGRKLGPPLGRLLANPLSE